MKYFGKVFFIVLWLYVFSFMPGCKTVQTREETRSVDKEQAVSVPTDKTEPAAPALPADTERETSVQSVDTEQQPVQSSFKREDLCSLLSKKEVGAILKKKMEEPEFFINQCKYKVVQPSALKEFSIEISYDDGSGFEYNRRSGREQGRKIRQVKDVGDAAYLDGEHLHVLKGHVWLIFWTGSSGKHPSEKVMKALAKRAVDRLPAQ